MLAIFAAEACRIHTTRKSVRVPLLKVLSPEDPAVEGSILHPLPCALSTCSVAEGIPALPASRRDGQVRARISRDAALANHMILCLRANTGTPPPRYVVRLGYPVAANAFGF